MPMLSLLLSLLPNATAGGDAEAVRVDQVHHDGDTATVTLSGGEDIFADCPTFTVSVRHEWVPWYGWLPLAPTLHPSHSQTADALDLLTARHQSGAPVTFGFMGSGLKEVGPCAYASRGLEVYDGDVYSFYDPI